MMGIELYQHNREAYRAVRKMLAEKGLAAVVHPTGTGKSFIAFKLCEDEPDKTVCWLSPSEYIFKTQLENLKATGAAVPQNIKFFTYAKLMNMSEAEMAEIRPDMAVYDEFHRAGAEMWSLGVERFRRMYPTIPLLGLTATSVRYLDSQRDMGEEVFLGNIASEMTLGEAIVRGILPAPKYVTTVFRYQNELTRLQGQVERVRGEGLKDANERYLEELRRALEKADGLDVVFQRHMANKYGKYILFCSDYDHIQELRTYTDEWFSKVNPDIHSYLAYSADPDTSKEFTAFKADDSKALKLLYCINMLNEGVHVKGISGVILFRPTVSPIIYKQQIGRALTAGDSATPLIIDVVNNFEGLCSIDSIKEEMELVVQQYRLEGRGDEIVTDRFEIIEQVQDCRELFERLERSLVSGWEQYFQAASIYAAENGDLQVPATYRTKSGLHLGEWLVTQRARKREGMLSESEITRLEGIGMVWENRLELAWSRAMAHCEQYGEEYGNLEVPLRYDSPDGYHLGAFIRRMRDWYANGEKRALLTPERIAALEALGMHWSAINLKWERNYLRAAEYYREHGDLLVPAGYKSPDGHALGAWINKLRRSRRVGELPKEQIERLDAIGMFWGNRHAESWETNYRAAEKYYQAHGDLDLTVGYFTEDGLPLGRWIVDLRRQRKNRATSLTPERIARLDAIGMIWDKASSWEYRYELCRKYLEENRCAAIPRDYKTDEGIWLGTWLYRQKRIAEGHSSQDMSDERRQKIRQLDIWGPDAKIDRRTKRYKRSNTAGRTGERQIGPV